MSISGNLVGSYSQLGKTFIITDADGNELTGVVVGQETVFTATDNDVREGFVYAGDEGVSIGTKNIPSYRTAKGRSLVLPGEMFSITNLLDYHQYDYTEFQGIICVFNTTFDDSVFTDKIVLNDQVYPVSSSNAISNITINENSQTIDFNFINDSDNIYVIHYFTYREEV